MLNCSTARLTISRDSQSRDWEHYWLGERYIFSNQIPNSESFTRTQPGWILADNQQCAWGNVTPPPRMTTEAATSPPEIVPMQADIGSAGGSGGGAILLVLALIGSAGYAYFQQRNSKGDFDSDYHPMADVPLLPPVATDENLDVVYERVSYPQYQGITEPSPWGSTQVHPRSQQPSSSAPITTPSPVIANDTAVMRSDFITSDGAGDETGDALKAEARQHFELQVLPAPKNGYDLSEESLLNKGTAYWLVWQAVQLNYSKNWLCEHLFKIPKGGTGQKYKLLTDLVNRIKGELGHE